MKNLEFVRGHLAVLMALAVAAALAAQDSRAVRKWTDDTGSYQVDAEFVDFSEGVVKLKRNDGRVVSLPIKRLSEADQQWVHAKADVVPKPAPATDDARRELTPEHVINVGERVRALAISPDGRTIAAGVGGGTGILSSGPADVHLWQIDGRSIARLKGHPGRIRSISFAPDGKTLVSAGAGQLPVSDGVAVLWDVKRRTPRMTHQTPKRGVWNTAYLPDSRSIVLSGNGVELWDTQNGRASAFLPDQLSDVGGIAVSPNGELLACGARDKKAYVCELKHKRIVRTFDGFKKSPGTLSFSPDGASLAVSGFFESRTVIYDTKQWKEISSLETARELAYSPDGRFLCVLEFGKDGVSMFDTERYKLAGRLAGHSKVALSLAFSRDGKKLVTGDDTIIRVWDVSGLREPGAP